MTEQERVAMIKQLRADFLLTARREQWPQSDREEVSAAIFAAIEAADDEVLQGWAHQLAWWRLALESYAPRLRAFEARVKAEAREQERAAA